MPAQSCLVEIFAQVPAPSRLRHREPLWPERVNCSMAVAPRIAFGCAPLPSSRSISVRANIGEERPCPDGMRPERLIPRRAAAGEFLDRRVPVLCEQAIAQVAHVAKG